jgi:hypothetical protein
LLTAAIIFLMRKEVAMPPIITPTPKNPIAKRAINHVEE